LPLRWSSAAASAVPSAPLACLCSMYDLIKSEFSAICSSVMPICRSSSSSGRQDGSTLSKGDGLCDGLLGGGGAGWDSAPDGERWPWMRLPNRERPGPLPLATGAGPWPRVDAKGVCLVSLLACFSRSCIFLMKVLASFSSAKDRPAGHSSSSKVWKKVRSWL